MTKEEDEFGDFVIGELDKLFEKSMAEGKRVGLTEKDSRYIIIAVIAKCLNF